MKLAWFRAGVLLIQIGIAVTLHGQCPLSISPSYNASANTLVVTATLGGRACGIPGVAMNVEGSNFVYTNNCPSSAGCSLTFSYDTSCWAPGAHSLTAVSDCDQLVNGSCQRAATVQANSSFSIPDATPQASISVEPLSPTSIRVHMVYTFTDTSSSAQRGLKLEHYLPNGSPDNFYWVSGAATASGEWTRDFDTTCWLPGGHRFVFTATACGRYGKDAQTTFSQPDEKASLAASVVNTSTNSVRVDMTWAFTAATASHTNHALSLHHFNPDGSEGGVYWIYGTDQQTGTWSQSFDTTCWPNGTHIFKAFAIVCDRTTTEADQPLAIDHRPHLAVSIQNTEPIKAALTYRFASDNPAARTLTLEFLPEFPSTVPIQVMQPVHPDANTPNPLIVDVPDFGRKGILRATATNSCGESVVVDNHLDCCHANEGPRTDSRPVRFWDGSMTYTEHDPLPSDSFPLFVRSYDTLNTTEGYFGIGWHSAFDAGLVHFMDGGVDTVTIRMEGERRASFMKVGGVWTQSWPMGVGAPATLTTDANGWRYRDAGSSLVRLFGADGRFGGFQDLATSKTVLIDYGASGPVHVRDADGTWSCSIAMDGNHIVTISVDGRSDLVWQYAYAGSQLLSVSLSGSSPAWRTYGYTAGLLSSVTDPTGALIESHTFDAQGRATSSVGGSTTDISSIVYGLTGTLPDSTITQAIYATGESTTFEQRYVQGRQQTIATVGGCGSCGSRNTTYGIDDATGRLVRSQDARGYIRSFSYDAVGRLSQERRYDRPASCDPEADPAHCRVSAGALLTIALQPTTASTYITYGYADPLWPDKPTTIAQPSVLQSDDSRVETIVYDANTGTVLSRTSSGWTLDASGHAVRVDERTVMTLYDGTAPAAFDPGRSFSSSWLTLPQPAGKRKSIDGPRTDVSDITSFVYYPVDGSVPAANRGRLAAVRNAAGHITTYDNYDVFGNPGTVIDPNGVTRDTTFDALGRAATTTLRALCPTGTDPSCNRDDVTTSTYVSVTGPLALRTDPNRNVARYEYDGRGRVTALSRGLSDSSLSERMESSYDPATGRKSSDRYLGWSSDGGVFDWRETRRESFSYDTLAQLAAQTHSDGASIGYTYDDAGSLASVRDENHATATTRYTYDSARRLTTTRQTLGTGEITTSYGYDVAGDLASVTDPNGNVTTYIYDDFGRMLSQSSPVTGTTTYAYDAAGNLISTTDANHATTSRTYDSLNRILTAVSSVSGAPTETVTRTYDDAATLGLGRLASMTDPSGTTTYAYERRGLLTREVKSIDGASYTTTFGYDATVTV